MTAPAIALSRRKEIRLGVAAMIASAACWGLATVMSKAALSAVPPFTLLVIQLTASVSFLWVVTAATQRRLSFGRKERRASLTGLLEPGLAYGFGVPGLALTSAANASIIGTAEPAFVCLLAWLLLAERPTQRLVLAMVTGMVGVAMITLADVKTPTAGGGIAGDALVVAGTLFAALYVVLSSRQVAKIDPLPLAAMQQSVGLASAILLLGAVLALDLEALPASISLPTLLLAAASGVVQFALAFWFYLIGLRVLPASMAALFLALIPVFGVGGAMIFLGEEMLLLQWPGCALVIASVAMMARRAGN